MNRKDREFKKWELEQERKLYGFPDPTPEAPSKQDLLADKMNAMWNWVISFKGSDPTK